MKKRTLLVGTRVMALIGEPVRYGTIIRSWAPYAQYRVRWNDGAETNIDRKYLRGFRSRGKTTKEAV